MRRVFWIVALALLIFAQGALASSVAGKWSGTMTVDGKRYHATVRFSSGGSFSAAANGLTVSGSYSVSGNSVRMEAWGVTVRLKLKEQSGRQSLSGSASEFGKGGSIALSRKAPDEESSRDEPDEFGAWALEAGGRAYSLKLYKAGFAHWSEGPAGSEPDAQLYAALEVLDGALVLEPLGPAGSQAVPPGLAAFRTAEGGYEIPCALENGLLTIDGFQGFENCGEALDSKPADAPFLPYLNLRQGDRGQAVAWLQRRLIDLGYLEGEADGIFGQDTGSALARFQADAGLARDGVAGAEVIARLAP